MKSNLGDETTATPAAQGFFMPAEWEPHHATWIGWPHNSSDWPGKFATIKWVYGEIVRHLTTAEDVYVLVNSAAHESQARRVLKDVGAVLERVRFFRIATNRGWTRDFGPMFVKRKRAPNDCAVVKFRFNAWACYPDWQLDDKAALKAAKKQQLKVFHAQLNGRPVVLEGGAIDANGRGTLITTEECLLDQKTQVRNPGMTRAETEQVLREYLGVRHVMWLRRGIAGDDTHGHVDDLCRFVNDRALVLCTEKDSSDPNYLPLQENRELLQDLRLQDGSRPEVIDLPMPSPLYFRGRRLPASYANFYLSNAAVLVPTFNDPNDRLALGIIADLFPDRKVIGIHAVDLVWGFGTLHCLTQQQPSV